MKKLPLSHVKVIELEGLSPSNMGRLSCNEWG